MNHRDTYVDALFCIMRIDLPALQIEMPLVLLINPGYNLDQRRLSRSIFPKQHMYPPWIKIHGYIV